jgi:hypothetical protein
MSDRKLAAAYAKIRSYPEAESILDSIARANAATARVRAAIERERAQLAVANDSELDDWLSEYLGLDTAAAAPAPATAQFRPAQILVTPNEDGTTTTTALNDKQLAEMYAQRELQYSSDEVTQKLHGLTEPPQHLVYIRGVPVYGLDEIFADWLVWSNAWVDTLSEFLDELDSAIDTPRPPVSIACGKIVADAEDDAHKSEMTGPARISTADALTHRTPYFYLSYRGLRNTDAPDGAKYDISRREGISRPGTHTDFGLVFSPDDDAADAVQAAVEFTKRKASYAPDAFILSVIPIESPTDAPFRFQPLRTAPATNCVADLARDYVNGLKSKRKDEMLAGINEWESIHLANGATHDAIADLPRILRRSVRELVAGGFTAWTSPTYTNENGVFQFYAHNGHATATDPIAMPAVASQRIFTLGEIAEIVKSAGRIRARLDETGGVASALDGNGCEYISAREHGLRAEILAAIPERIRVEYALDANTESIRAAWTAARVLNNWGASPAELIDILRESCFEAVHWNSGRRDTIVNEYDITAAYPSAARGCGPVSRWYTGCPSQYLVIGPASDPRARFVCVESITFITTNIVIIDILNGQLRKSSWIAVELYSCLTDLNIARMTISAAILDTFGPSAVWLSGKNSIDRVLIGMCTSAADRFNTEWHASDDNAITDYITIAADKVGRGQVRQFIAGRQFVGLRSASRARNYQHVRSWILGCHAVNLISALAETRADMIAAVKTDSIWAPAAAGVPCASGDDAGFMRLKRRNVGALLHPVASGHVAPPSLKTFEMPLGTYSVDRVEFWTGPGGCGKSYSAVGEFPDSMLLTPLHTLSADHCQMINERGLPTVVRTWHSAFKYIFKLPELRCGEWIAQYAPMIPSDTFAGKVVLWDEACMVPLTVLRALTRVALRMGARRIIYMGDPAQCGPIAGDSPAEWLRSLPTRLFTDDRRSIAGDPIAALKFAMRSMPEAEARATLLAAGLRTVSETNLIREATSRDIIACYTHKSREWFQSQILNKALAERWPAIPIMYSPISGKKPVASIDVPGIGAVADPYRGQTWSVDVDSARAAIHLGGFRIAVCRTGDSLQGTTVRAGCRLFVHSSNTTQGTIYTLISRAQRLEDIILVK